MIINGDSLLELKKLPENSIDSVVTDPPYGLSFMGKKWDYDVPKVELWQEVFRVLKPGGHLLAFAGTRTQHRMAVNIEDAGFEIRDMIAWVYGSGFPKSLNIAKSLDKLQKTGNASWNGTGDSTNGALGYSKLQHEQGYRPDDYSSRHKGEYEITDEIALKWKGFGTSLKPALEPITVARKPIKGSVAQNVLKWGTGGINIDGCRVTLNGEKQPTGSGDRTSWREKEGRSDRQDWYASKTSEQGRFPANLIHDGSDEVVGLFPETKSGNGKPRIRERGQGAGMFGLGEDSTSEQYADSGSAARFFYKAEFTKGELCNYSTKTQDNAEDVVNEAFSRSYSMEQDCTKRGSAENAKINTNKNSSRFYYVPKASKSERNKGLEGFEVRTVNDGRDTPIDNAFQRGETPRANVHPTVKPVKLMQYLVRLVTPKGGTVLDPFNGSGTTGIACKLEGFDYIGIELDPEYCKISEARIEAWQPENISQPSSKPKSGVENHGKTPDKVESLTLF